MTDSSLDTGFRNKNPRNYAAMYCMFIVQNDDSNVCSVRVCVCIVCVRVNMYKSTECVLYAECCASCVLHRRRFGSPRMNLIVACFDAAVDQ